MMRRSHDLVGRIVKQSAIFAFFFFSTSWILFTLSAVLTTVWRWARSRSRIERSACGFETGFLGN